MKVPRSFLGKSSKSTQILLSRLAAGNTGEGPRHRRKWRMIFREFNNKDAYNEVQAVRQASADINPGTGQTKQCGVDKARK